IGVTVAQTPDVVTPDLPALLQYQLTLKAPRPPAGTFNQEAARRGEAVFNGAGRCASCHVPPLFTDVVRARIPVVPLLHNVSEIPTDSAYAARSATRQWRT